MIDNSPVKQRLHITFGKFDALVYISNLDVAKMWERVLRRANLPILYSEGFNPRPRLALASALPLGISSECEILDVSLREAIPLEGLAERILATSPAGLRIYGVRDVPIRVTSLAALVRSAEYRIHFEDGIDAALLQSRIDELLQSSHVPQEKERNGKPIIMNARSSIEALSLMDGDLIARLSVGERGNYRPDELLKVMQLDQETVSVHRFRLNLERS